ncbi:MAG: cell division protein FtsZ [Anaerolineales bacterium]|nr:cell division protein FtsZ [Anaerolineales bacterium]
MHELIPSTPTRSPTPKLEPTPIGHADVKVLGLGGAGSNAVNRMIELGLSGVDFIAANTDKQALNSSLAPTRIQLGPRSTRGLGAGGDPRIGATAALESNQDLTAALRGADMVFITAGMGGGTGTGAAPIAAEIARENGAVVIAVVTMPFSFEMTRRAENANLGIQKLQPHTHTLITVPNDKLLQIVPKDLSLEIAFRLADDVLRQGVQGISELITRPGLINVDFAHVRKLLLNGGGGYLAIGLGEGPEKAHNAIQQALNHPLLELNSLDQATGILVQFTGGDELTLYEIGEAVNELRNTLSTNVDIILGATTEPSMAGRTQVILIVTGIGAYPMRGMARKLVAERQVEEGMVSELPAVDDLDVPAFIRKRLAIG